MLPSALEMQILRFGEKHNIKELRELIAKTNIKEINKILLDRVERKNGFNFWNYLLLGFDPNIYEAREQRFSCIKTFMEALTRVELNYKQTYDYVARLCQDLHTFPNEQLVEILELCIDGIRIGDAKCLGWKDLLPETMKVLSALPLINVNGISMNGAEYRNITFRNLCTMRWPNEVLTPIADMFKNLTMSASETTIVLQKFAGMLASLSPLELPALAYQLFGMCASVTQLLVPLLALKQYFHRFYYKKLFADMNSNSTDFDSIDDFSDKEMREAEETILNHLNYCTQYKFNEQHVFIVLKNFINLPDVILTPFMLSAILTMTTANRDPNACLSRSLLLPLLRTVIKHNEHERNLAEHSVWCRDSLQRKQVDLDQVFSVLVDQNKEGKDVITPGLVNLVFVLLKSKQMPELHSLAYTFLTRFIRKRFIFGSGIVKKLCEWMVVEQQQNQFAECLTLLSTADTFTVSECLDSIKYVMDFFLWIPGAQAMRMLSFILPVLKISALVRDALIEVLRKAMNSSETQTRCMAVYGFSMILKQLNNSNSLRSQMSGSAAGMCTQHSISGYSLMSQATLGQRNNPQRHFDLLTLEIIGLLRKCFSQSLEIKQMLYENLQRAVELNFKLAPHVLQFIDWHFRSYFDVSAAANSSMLDDDGDEDNDAVQKFSVKWLSLVNASDEQEQEITIHDNLGRLTLFICHCLVIYSQCETFYSIKEIQRLLDKSVEKTVSKELNFEDTTGTLTFLKCELLVQQAIFMQALMAYVLLTSKQTNDNIKNLSPIFQEHQRILEALKKMSTSSKKKKGKHAEEDGDATFHNATINGVIVKRPNTQVENIWDLAVVERFLRLLHEDIVPFAASHNTVTLRSNCELVRYVLTVAAAKVENIRQQPDYKQLAHSKRTLRYLTDITKVIYERCIKRLPELWRDFDAKSAILAAECFKQCLLTANEVYKSKFTTEFIKGFDFNGFNKCKEAPALLHDIIDEFMQEQEESPDENSTETAVMQKIPVTLMHCLEIFYDNLSYSNRLTTESYTWLLNFCKTYEVTNEKMGYVHKLLFAQRQKTHSGAFFNIIALHLGKTFGVIEEKHPEKNHDEDDEDHLSFELKSITLGSVESCLNYLYATLRKQILDVEHFVIKASNLNYKYRLVHDEERDLLVASLRALERSICSQLVHISNALLNLTNVTIPLGNCMDSMIKLLMQFYVCLKNMTRHLLNCCNIMQLNIKNTKFDILLRMVGKRLPANIYTLITYIEANIFQEEDNAKRKVNPKADKAKVLRETKLIPKLILYVENFNKHVILLSKKTDDRLSGLLHFGVVRDFRIRSSELKAAIERTLSHSSQIQPYDSAELEAGVDDVARRDCDEETLLDPEEMEQMQAELANSAENLNDIHSDEQVLAAAQPKKKEVATVNAKKDKRKRRREVLSDEDEVQKKEVAAVLCSASSLLQESNKETSTQVLKNLAAINKKAAKRVLRNSSQLEYEASAVMPPPETQPKRGGRRGRSARGK